MRNGFLYKDFDFFMLQIEISPQSTDCLRKRMNDKLCFIPHPSMICIISFIINR